ncbi:enoyl-CoA hydratase/isomerase family protein [Amycolatopsis sp. WAC 01375]|uniref:enoyl-CoA hydratase/isomerase family protein n=1 Tax=unclassified Amycolatopsis TaxID=2618356 RepID=UPI000F77C882|nr:MULTISPECIES: enoyl-CoA hydratase/isomerase family protein [unclassified Amycolatopsis]RSM82949.1 enoyl-CoA hydratase/isomerase family protein [Amycolatopsis sp. WAC 01375]RSN36275.1 enoyl-CoA hydratase/isomerase family protein [Amycolatopsis sp. WAC 01416]
MTVTLLTEDRDRVRILTLDRPEKLNALDTALTLALRDALDDADRDPGVRAVVLTGNGRGFCAGADLSEFSALTPDQPGAVLERAALTAGLQTRMQRMGTPVVTAVRGAAVGGGAGLAIGADMVVAGDDLRFGYPELRHSLVPALVMTGLVRHLGRKLAFELISTGRLLTAAEAFEHGLVNRVVAPEDVLTAALEIAGTWAAVEPRALSAAKDLFYRVGDLPTDAAMRAGQDVNALMRGFRR